MIEHLLALPIVFYRRFLSPLKPPTCRFVPTCSQYGIDALRQRGPIIGLLLLAWRLLRCHPFCAPGYDPVPPGRQRGEPRAQRGRGSS